MTRACDRCGAEMTYKGEGPRGLVHFKCPDCGRSEAYKRPAIPPRD